MNIEYRDPSSFLRINYDTLCSLILLTSEHQGDIRCTVLDCILVSDYQFPHVPMTFKAIVDIVAIDLHCFSRITSEHNGPLSCSNLYFVYRYLLISRLARIIEIRLGLQLHWPWHWYTLA